MILYVRFSTNRVFRSRRATIAIYAGSCVPGFFYYNWAPLRNGGMLRYLVLIRQDHPRVAYHCLSILYTSDEYGFQYNSFVLYRFYKVGPSPRARVEARFLCAPCAKGKFRLVGVIRARVIFRRYLIVDPV